MKYLFVFCFMIATCCCAQDETLMHIVNSDSPIEQRQQKIDSLVKIKDSENPNETLADFYHDLGSKWYYNNWWYSGKSTDIEKAIFYAKKAYLVKKEQNHLEQEASLERTLYNLGYFNYLKGDFYEAMDFYLALINDGEDDRLIQKATSGLGMTYMSMGDFYKALEAFNNILAFYRKNPGNETTLIETHIQLAEIYSVMGIEEHSEEISLQLRKADSIFKKHQIEEFYLANEINHLEGNRLLETGYYAEAISFYQKVLKDSLDLFEYDLARVYNSLAYSQLKLEKFELSFQNLNKSIAYDPNYIHPYENLGDFYLAKNDFKKSLYHYQKAIAVATDTDTDNKIKFDQLPILQDLELSANKIDLLNSMITKANGWLKYYEHDQSKVHLTHALETFALADKLVDIIRSESTEYQSKLFWREKGASLYAKAVEVCYLLNKPDDAYYFMERNKALLLLEDITNEQAKEIAHLPKPLAKREFELKQGIFLAENELQNNKSKSVDTLSLLRSRIYEQKNAYNSFVDSLSSAFPEYAKIKKKVDVLPIINFKKNFISEDEVVLQYILNDEQGYGLLTTADQTEFFKIEDVEELNQNIIELYGHLTNLTMDRAALLAYNQLSQHVFGQLVPKSVHEKVRDKKLTIINDYILQQIPFEAFVTDGDLERYFIEDTEIRYAYSMSYLEAKTHVSGQPEKELYAVAPVQFASLGLPSLMFSGTEVADAQKIFTGSIALKNEATKAAFLANFADYRIVHLSTHADVGESEDPWIAFSDKKMFLNEIYATKNQADMVVLSACNTSVGELKKGEGAMSLARGFFHSGAQSVVSSLWSANDKSSKELLIAFYKGLDEGLTKSAAMRKAKTAYIEKYRGSKISPSFWAALVVIGDNSPLTDSSAGPLLWILSGITILVVLLFFFFNNKRPYFNS